MRCAHLLIGFLTPLVVAASGTAPVRGDEKQLEADIQLLANKDRPLPSRLNACKAIAAAGPNAKQAVPILRECLKEPKPDLQVEVARALGKIGPDAKAAVADMAGLLEPAARPGDVKPGSEEETWLHLAKQRADQKRRSDGVEMLYDPVSSALAQALGEIGPDARPALPQLVAFLRQRLNEAAEAAKKEGRPARLELADDLCGRVAEAIGRVGGAEDTQAAVRVLVAFIEMPRGVPAEFTPEQRGHDARRGVANRVKAVQSLGALGSNESKGALRELKRSDDELIRKAAEKALEGAK